ncbi:50S ribosomal protein L6 [Holosporaceae bacterium 'Namur']|nr:50S ribosomal protein L6 [Holosporaceae bacterium 'Namur']
MSRVGKLPITIPGSVKVNLDHLTLDVSGPKGSLKRTFAPEVSIKYNENQVRVAPIEDTSRARAMWGLTQRLISNMVKGVSEGFTQKLEISGVGFKASFSDSVLVLSLGFSHDIIYAIPKNIAVVCEKPTLISISGCDKELVGKIASEIRSLKKPEPYKGKGIKYENEKIRRKEGKKK